MPGLSSLTRTAKGLASGFERTTRSTKVITITLSVAGVEFITVDKKPFYDATAPVREKYGAQFAELIQRIEAVQ